MDFNEVMAHILRYEGGLTFDTGGWTKYGISQKEYPYLDIRDLSRQDALNIYYHDYWMPLHLDTDPPDMRLAIMDAAVNEGTHKAEQFCEATCAQDNLAKFLALRRDQYERLVRLNPNKYGKYLHGWIYRLHEVALASLVKNQLQINSKSSLPNGRWPDHPPGNIMPSPYTTSNIIPTQVSLIEPIETVQPKSMFVSNIAYGTASMGVMSVIQTVFYDPETQNLFSRLFHRPSFWLCLVIIVLCGFILYHRWRDHGRGQKRLGGK